MDLADGYRGWVGIVTTLGIETAFLSWAFPLSLRKAAPVSVAMNLASGLFGVFVLPLLGLVWESMDRGLLAFATYSWANLALTYAVAVIANVVIETLVVLACGVHLGRRRIAWIAAANGCSVALIFLIYVMN
jgi:hypothetical protein